MKSLENRGYDSKREMEILDALEEVKQMNRRLAKVNHEELLLKTLAKYDVEKEMIERLEKEDKEKFDQLRKDKLKYKRIDDEQEGADYEDGDNFDRGLAVLYGEKKNRKKKGEVTNVENPYLFLE